MTRRPREEDIAQYFDQNIDCCAPRRDPTKRPGVKLARLLEHQLRTVGVQGRTVLELGCGRGELSGELVAAGASRVTGMDLSPDNIEAARRIASEDGLGDRLSFQVGNAATAALHPHDVVVHHRVICCYPDPNGFLANSIDVAGSVYGFSMPRSKGIVGLLARTGLLLENVIHRLKGHGFRAYVHDERRVEDALRSAGFHLRGKANRLGWFAAVYSR
jgi:magnesium-protoporphyrin O-methyltransferase